MNHNISFCFLTLSLPFCTLFACFFWSKTTEPSKQQQKKHTATENTNFCSQFCCWEIKIFYKDRMCLLKKIAVDSVLLLKAVPSNPCKNADKIPLSSPFPWTMVKESGSCGLRTRGENLLR